MRRVYETVEAIDQTLLVRGGFRLPDLIELANFSSMLGNLLAQGIVDESGGAFQRAGPHKYQDLRGTGPSAVNIEIKMALEDNRPKGHLPKAGHYLACRYVLCSDSGEFTRGRETRGRIPRFWDLRVGELDGSDFTVSNTEGDSGKTAVVKPSGMKKLGLVYFDPELIPRASVDRYIRDYCE